MGNILSYIPIENLNNIRDENIDLKKKNLELTNKLLKLEEKINNQIDKDISDKKSIDNFEESMRESINSMVDDMLKNDSINSNILPDYIEKKICNNIFTSVVGIVKNVLEDVKINIFNQVITLKIQPESTVFRV